MKSDDRDQSYAQKTDQKLQIVFLQNRAPSTDPPILLFEAGLLYESCLPLTCVSTRFWWILGSFAFTRGPFNWKFPVFIISPKTENPENQPVASYDAVELRKFRSDEKIVKYWISWITDGKNHEIWPEAFSSIKYCPSTRPFAPRLFPFIL